MLGFALKGLADAAAAAKYNKEIAFAMTAKATMVSQPLCQKRPISVKGAPFSF